MSIKSKDSDLENMIDYMIYQVKKFIDRFTF